MLYYVGIQCLCLFWLTMVHVFLLFFFPPILLSSSFLFCFNAVEPKKCPWIMHFFLENKISIWHQIVKLCKQSTYGVLVMVLKNSLIMHRKKKKRLALTYLGPRHLCSLWVADQVLIKFTPEPACNQRCLCRFFLKIS